MKLRSFLAKDMREALASVRAELGADAVIVASEKSRSGGILVRAAVEEPETGNDNIAPAPSGQDVAPTGDFEDRFRTELVRRLRSPSGATPSSMRDFERPGLLAILRSHRVPDRLSHEIAEAAEKSGQRDMTLALASALDKRMRPEPIHFGSSSALLLCGIPGAGKTATAAKIAAHARLSGRDVCLIGADSAGAGAVSRLNTFADHLGAKCHVADNATAIAEIVSRAVSRNSLAIVDTAGLDPRNAKSRTAFSALTKLEGLETVAVMSALADAEETAEISAAFAALGARRAIVTCLDLTQRAGALLAATTQGLPIAHVCRSPFVAGGFDTLTPLSLSRLLIEREHSTERGPQ